MLARVLSWGLDRGLVPINPCERGGRLYRGSRAENIWGVDDEVGGIYVLLGPTVGAFITILLAESLRIGFGTSAVGWDNIIYGSLLVVFIIFLPQGLVGSLQARFSRARPATS